MANENTLTITRNTILSELSKSPHGDYATYIPTVLAAAKHEPEFLARLISWNRDNGQIRDAKIGLPLVSLLSPDFKDPAHVENSLSHLALLDPRNLLKAIRFSKSAREKTGHSGRKALDRLVTRYLQYRESDWSGRFEPSAARYKSAMHELYALCRVRRPEKVGTVLFGGERGHAPSKPARGTLFDTLSQLASLSTLDVVNFITTKRIPFLTAKGALGERIAEPDILRVLVTRMSPTELTTNVKELERLGMRNLPAVRGAFEQAMERAAKSAKNVLKTTKAVEVLEDEGLKSKLRGLQERQIENIANIEGNWLVLGDKSGSMSACIGAACQVAGTLSKLVKGKVYLVFFDIQPYFIEVTGKSYEEILRDTRMISAAGGTSIGCGLQYLLDRNIKVQGIAIVSDARENSAPFFADRYTRYVQVTGEEPAVYLYRYGGYQPVTQRFSTGQVDIDLRDRMAQAGLQLAEFDVATTTDHYAIPNMARSMTTKHYGLIDQVMNSKLITLDMVFGAGRGFSGVNTGSTGSKNRKEKVGV